MSGWRKQQIMEKQMTEWTKEEDEAFNEVEKHSNLGKQILREMDGQPYFYDLFVSVSQRNQVLEEVAKRFDAMHSLGDTAASFACYVRDMKK
jgi:hypothetical protein